MKQTVVSCREQNMYCILLYLKINFNFSLCGHMSTCVSLGAFDPLELESQVFWAFDVLRIWVFSVNIICTFNHWAFFLVPNKYFNEKLVEELFNISFIIKRILSLQVFIHQQLECVCLLVVSVLPDCLGKVEGLAMQFRLALNFGLV